MSERGARIDVVGLRHAYPSPTGPLTVLEEIDLHVPAGAYTILQGASGAGKSTLLGLLGGLERPQHGTATVGGVDLTRLSGDGLARYRRSVVGFVFQHFGLLEALTALENVELACALAAERPKARRRRANDLLEAVGLGARARHRPAQLSGGERQRVAIARALANRPRLLLADEPTGNLDEDAAEAVIGLMESVSRETGCTLVVVTHNRTISGRAPFRLRLAAGRVVAA